MRWYGDIYVCTVLTIVLYGGISDHPQNPEVLNAVNSNCKANEIENYGSVIWSSQIKKSTKLMLGSTKRLTCDHHYI